MKPTKHQLHLAKLKAADREWARHFHRPSKYDEVLPEGGENVTQGYEEREFPVNGQTRFDAVRYAEVMAR